ncbi:hypothetical protein [Streptomyces sp. NPDC001933]|uniref:hypothetical protein n=1 Tax=Streptomyces sp. NPDC001933 TaxID=3364626 RepID=UPI00368BDFF0
MLSPTGPGPAPEWTLLSWGLGADSTAVIAVLCEDPTSYGLREDLSDLVIVTSHTGEEWPDTYDLAESHVLPLLRRYNVRLVQLARAGQSDAAGYVVLSDTRQPHHLHRRGPWALSDEYIPTGTLPQYANKKRICSIRAKGSVIDRWVADEFGDAIYRHAIGFEATETGRSERDTEYASPTRRPWYPLIEWGWDRTRLQSFLQETFGVSEWPKSYCALCCFPVTMASRDKHLERCRTFPQVTAKVLLLEHRAMALNPRSTLYRDTSLKALLADDGNETALSAYEQLLDESPWAVYNVRRVFFARRSDTCRAQHATTCTTPLPGCRDTTRKGTCWRSTRTMAIGPRDAIEQYLHRLAHEAGTTAVAKEGISRALTHEPGTTYPTAEGLLVAAPAGIEDKERAHFSDRWDRVLGTNTLPMDLGS